MGRKEFEVGRRERQALMPNRWLRSGYQEPPMPAPDKAELEFTIVLFLVLAPLGYWAVWTLMALVAAPS